MARSATRAARAASRLRDPAPASGPHGMPGSSSTRVPGTAASALSCSGTLLGLLVDEPDRDGYRNRSLNMAVLDWRTGSRSRPTPTRCPTIYARSSCNEPTRAACRGATLVGTIGCPAPHGAGRPRLRQVYDLSTTKATARAATWRFTPPRYRSTAAGFDPRRRMLIRGRLAVRNVESMTPRVPARFAPSPNTRPFGAHRLQASARHTTTNVLLPRHRQPGWGMDLSAASFLRPTAGTAQSRLSRPVLPCSESPTSGPSLGNVTRGVSQDGDG